MRYNRETQTGFTLISGSVKAMLCTVGIAGLQASYVDCSVHDHVIYVYVPSSSDQLSNLAQATEVLLTTPTWQLQGVGAVATDDTLQMMHVPPALIHDIDRLGLVIVMITPRRMQVEPLEISEQRETIDFTLIEGLPLGIDE